MLDRSTKRLSSIVVWAEENWFCTVFVLKRTKTLYAVFKNKTFISNQLALYFLVGKAGCPDEGEDLALWIFSSGAECVQNT